MLALIALHRKIAFKTHSKLNANPNLHVSRRRTEVAIWRQRQRNVLIGDVRHVNIAVQSDQQIASGALERPALARLY